jgi:ABC-type lipoprotein release transport system permease subunit
VSHSPDPFWRIVSISEGYLVRLISVLWAVGLTAGLIVLVLVLAIMVSDTAHYITRTWATPQCDQVDAEEGT